MKIIQGSTKEIAGPVTNWAEIMSDAKEMADMIDKGGFEGNWTDCFALAHAQVSDSPKAFFVVDKKVAESFNGHRVIANAKIVKKSCPRSFQEGCMSFPYRSKKTMRRYDKITIECDILEKRHELDKISIKEMLVPARFELEGLEAYIVQHEIDHAKGIDIYHK